MADYEFTGFVTNEVMDILLTAERDVCNSLCNCKDIKEGMFKTGAHLSRARCRIYDLLKAEQDKSYEAKEAREARVCIAESEGEE